ncbi:MAG TPA: MOSC domain-containing protein [Pseudomonadales bacterium]
MNVGTVRSLFRYPVKSMGGESLNTLDIGSRGVVGDRAWALRDETLGGIRGGKRFPELMQCTARYLNAPPTEGSAAAEITLPDGTVLGIGDPDAPDRLSELVGSPVTVWPLQPADDLDHYRRGAPVLDDMEAEFRRMFGRTEHEPLPDVSKFPEFLAEFESPPGTYFDAFPILLMTTESLAYLQQKAPGHAFDVRRFRPNILIETGGGAGFPERDWAGTRLRIGTVELAVTIDCPRCVMTTHPVDDLPRDPGIMRTLVRECGGELGIYAAVSSPGTIRAGDALELL